jgi:phosphate uptake regulator
MADHAVNIGERVNYMVTGEMPGFDSPNPDDSAGIRLD